MVSERRLVRGPTSNHQTLIELNCKSPPICSISSIASFREKQFKKNHIFKNTSCPNYAGATASCDAVTKQNTQKPHVSTSVNQPTMEHKKGPRRKQAALYPKKGRSNLGSRTVLNPACKQKYHHSPRSFSLFTLQEYLHERSHDDHNKEPAAYDMYANGIEECELYMESSHILQSLDKATDATPLLQSQLQCSYTRKPRQNREESYVSKCKCNRMNCKHVHKDEYQYSPAYSTAQEIVNDDGDDDEKNEAFSVEGHLGCVPWHSLSFSTPKCNKKQIIMELAGRSFGCVGFPVSKLHNRMGACTWSRNVPTARPSATREVLWDSSSSNFESESAPLLSEAYDGFSHSRCYPACNSLPRVMRRKLQLADGVNKDANLQSKLRCGNRSRNAKSNAYGGMRRKKSQLNNTTSRRKGAICATNKTTNDDSISHHSYQSVKDRKKGQGNFKRITAESRVKHQSLSEKYRPRTFEEMVGQCMVSQALSNAVLKGKIAPVYLFQGPRGTGKTSAARIFAASINCLSNVMKSSPCGFCKHCESLFLGKSSNVREVDASGNNCIEDMKSLLRFITMGPQSTKYKVLIIDECHLLTKEAWSLFLNILEVPPMHVVFILIMADTEQLPRMVVSKCQKFPFTKIKDADILLRLRRVCDMEQIDAEVDALQLIASRSEGSLYDAETTLNQLTNLGQRITSGVVREMVGLVADEKLEELLEGAMRGDSVNTVRSTRELMEAGIEPLALMSQLATLITDLLAGDPRSTSRPQPLSKVELEKLRQALRILSEAEKQLRSCNNRTTWLTAALLQFSPMDSVLHYHPQHPHSYEEAQAQSSSLGTSLTQSPIALLDTSEKETTDMLCNTTADTANVKPPWDISQHWRDDEEERLDGQRKQHVLYTSSMEKPENIDANKHINLHGKSSEINLADDVVVSNYGAYHLHQSPHWKDTRVSCEGCLQEPSTIAGHSYFEYPSCNKDSSQVTPSSMDDIWRKVLKGSVLSEILSGQGKLLSLSVSEAYAIAHLEFRLVEDKKRAEKAKSSISKAFQMALGCPVEVKLCLASSQGDVKGDSKSNNGGGASENRQINHKKYRRKKNKTRSNRACCNQASISAKYYSKHRTRSNSSNSHRFSGNYPFMNGHHISKVSSDESFSNWTHGSKSDTSPPCCYTHGLQKMSTGISSSLKVKTYGRADRTLNELNYAREIGFGSSGSHVNVCVEVEGDDAIVDDNSQDLLYTASLQVERDSPGCSSRSFNEYDLEYDRNTMTPAFRTGFLCWKGDAKKNTHEEKVRHYRARREREVAPLLGCVPCLHAS